MTDYVLRDYEILRQAAAIIQTRTRPRLLPEIVIRALDLYADRLEREWETSRD